MHAHGRTHNMLIHARTNNYHRTTATKSFRDERASDLSESPDKVDVTLHPMITHPYQLMWSQQWPVGRRLPSTDPCCPDPCSAPGHYQSACLPNGCTASRPVTMSVSTGCFFHRGLLCWRAAHGVCSFHPYGTMCLFYGTSDVVRFSDLFWKLFSNVNRRLFNRLKSGSPGCGVDFYALGLQPKNIAEIGGTWQKVTWLSVVQSWADYSTKELMAWNASTA